MILTHGFEVGKARGREVVESYMGRQSELDATTGVAARLDATLELMNLEDLVTQRRKDVDWT